MWQRYNGTTKIFEKSTDDGATWAALPLDAAIITQGSFAKAQQHAQTVYQDAVPVFTGAIKERSRGTALGEWISVAHNGANYTADVGTWTVESGDQITFAYTLVGKTMTVIFEIQTSSLSSTPNVLNIAIPGGFSPAKGTRNTCIVQNSTNTIGMVRVIASDTKIYIYKDASGSAYVSATNTMQTFGEITFEIA